MRADPRTAAALALGFGLATGLLRLFILEVFGMHPLTGWEAAGLLVAVPGHAVSWLIVGLPVVWARRGAVRALAALPTLLLLLRNVTAFHYEAVFGRLPGAGFLHYIHEARQVAPSLIAHAPPAWVAGELGVFILLLSGIAAVTRRLAPQPSRASRRAGMAILASSALLAAAAHALPASPGALFWSSRIPVVWLLESKLQPRSHRWFEPDDAWGFQRAIGHEPPFASGDPRAPLCAPKPRSAPRPGNGRSAILLILESVGRCEMEIEAGGRAVMPQLQRIARESLDFRDALAVGTLSCQALPAIFSGWPAQTATNVLWRRPLETFDGFPRSLRRRGYRTAYFHGSDLTFNQQRQYLRMVGFDEICEIDRREPTPVYGWG